MDTEYIVGKEQIRAINELYGGSLRSDAEIETALAVGSGRSVYRKVAYILRAILVGHPFTGGNKRTAFVVAMTMLEKCGINLSDERKELMITEIRRIAMENIRNADRIERLVRYVVKGD